MKIGLALSGGGMRGAAHIGAIKALEEYGIYPTHIAGTSAGAITGALYAYGFNCKEMLHFFKTIPLFSYKKYAINKPGFIDAAKYYDYFKKQFPEDNFNALKKSLFVTTTNILNGKLDVFTEGELIKPILASAAFPGLFSPIEMKGSLYVDGGVLNNFPVDLLKKECDQIIGVYLNLFETTSKTKLKHFYNVIERVITLGAVKSDLEKFSSCDILIAPKALSQFALFDKKNIDTIYKIGYDSMKLTLKNKQLNKDVEKMI
ncbi:patatin-like phospholipase family protein [Olleya sp. HaHaR_3_96]|uniref:patatin-like phospholipase family protein n=1 Tax=Olleya sp. HaHaR_3_96 TaxID=2745560 RepID=UPI001C4EA863|nr:patatin-like phospholipase family protein [Olleya sp. HaHaR_3_96]QXP58335.1 patatin-like phospholipase family protein [Olleya sp. HaHaR_3_96]